MKETDLRYVKTERAIRDAFFELLEESEFDRRRGYALCG